jgi:flagellar biogenesis protein FliO
VISAATHHRLATVPAIGIAFVALLSVVIDTASAQSTAVSRSAGWTAVGHGQVVPGQDTRLPVRLASAPAPQAAGQPAASDAADGGLGYQDPPPPGQLDLSGVMMRLVFGTVAVLVTCFASLWLARRWLPNAAVGVKPQGRIKVLDRLSLTSRSWLQLVEVEGRQVLVSCDAAGIRDVTLLVPSFSEQLGQDAEEDLPGSTRG